MADYSKDLYDYKYECMKNCGSYDDGYNEALEDFVENISLPMTEEQIGEIVERLKR